MKEVKTSSGLDQAMTIVQRTQTNGTFVILLIHHQNRKIKATSGIVFGENQSTICVTDETRPKTMNIPKIETMSAKPPLIDYLNIDYLNNTSKLTVGDVDDDGTKKLSAKDYTSAILGNGAMTVSLIGNTTCISGPVPFSGEGLIMADSVQLYGDNVSVIHQFPLMTEVLTEFQNGTLPLKGHLVSNVGGYAEIALPSGGRVSAKYMQLKSDLTPLNHFVGDAKQDMKLTYQRGLSINVLSHVEATDNTFAEVTAAADTPTAAAAADPAGPAKASASSSSSKKRARNQMDIDTKSVRDAKLSDKQDKQVLTIVQSLSVKSNLPYTLKAAKLKISFQGQHNAPRARHGGGVMMYAAAATSSKGATKSLVDDFSTALMETASSVEIAGPFVIPPGRTIITPPIRRVPVQVCDTFQDIRLGAGTESPTTMIKMVPVGDLTLLPSVVHVLTGPERATTNTFNVPLRKPGETFEANFGQRATITVLTNSLNWEKHTFTLKVRNNAAYQTKLRIGEQGHLLGTVEANSEKEYSGKDPDRD